MKLFIGGLAAPGPHHEEAQEVAEVLRERARILHVRVRVAKAAAPGFGGGGRALPGRAAAKPVGGVDSSDEDF
jgi:hypothetical protein